MRSTEKPDEITPPRSAGKTDIRRSDLYLLLQGRGQTGKECTEIPCFVYRENPETWHVYWDYYQIVLLLVGQLCQTPSLRPEYIPFAMQFNSLPIIGVAYYVLPICRYFRSETEGKCLFPESSPNPRPSRNILMLAVRQSRSKNNQVGRAFGRMIIYSGD